MTSFNQFIDQFRFSPKRAGYIGIEREALLSDVRTGKVVPRSETVLSRLMDIHGNRFGYELSACQVEERIGPTTLAQLPAELEYGEQVLRAECARHGLVPVFTDLGPIDMPTDHYQDPDGRYADIVRTLSPEQLNAACRSIGLHVHIGMPDHETARFVYNEVHPHVPTLCQMANYSNGERLRLYARVSGGGELPLLPSWDRYYQLSIEQRFVDDPRKCWWLLRISRYGTIEFRMFGSVPLQMVYPIAERCHALCMNAVAKYAQAA